MISKSLRERRYLSYIFAPSFASVFVAVCAMLSYLHFFQDAIIDGEWQHANGFARILIPDTYVYLNLLDEDFSIFGLLLAGVKNAIGPALMWWVVDASWYAILLVNMAIVLTTTRYIAKICMHFGMPWREAARLCIIIGLLPTTWYHSIGALKELPTLLGMTAFFYYYVTGKSARCFLAAVALVIFRYQLVVILPAFCLIGYFSNKPLRATAVALALVSMAYPALSWLGIFSQETSALYREEAETAGVGAWVETVRDHVPVASALAVFVRVLQTTFEPIITFIGSWSVVEDGDVSIFACAYLSSALMLTPSIWRTGARNWAILRSRQPIPKGLQNLYALIIIFAVPVGGYSFIHGRYLFPLTALVLIAGSPNRAKTARA